MRQYLGNFEKSVLTAILALENRAYGIEIWNWLETELGTPTSISAVYTALDRMERKGYLLVKRGASIPERGGKAKSYFSVNAAGKRILHDTAEKNTQLLSILQPLLENN